MVQSQLCGAITFLSTISNYPTGEQARNQLGTHGGAKSFRRGAQIFQTMSNKVSLTCFSRGEKNFAGGFRPPWLRACRRVKNQSCQVTRLRRVHSLKEFSNFI